MAFSRVVIFNTLLITFNLIIFLQSNPCLILNKIRYIKISFP